MTTSIIWVLLLMGTFVRNEYYSPTPGLSPMRRRPARMMADDLPLGAYDFEMNARASL